jgi:hypothetical protein
MFTAIGVADVALGGTVIGAPGPNLVQGHDQQQLPQFLAGRNIVQAGAGHAEKAAKNRLHDVVGVQARPQVGAALDLGQGPQPMGIAQINLRGRILITGAKAAQQGPIGDLLRQGLLFHLAPPFRSRKALGRPPTLRKYTSDNFVANSVPSHGGDFNLLTRHFRFDCKPFKLQ